MAVRQRDSLILIRQHGATDWITLWHGCALSTEESEWLETAIRLADGVRKTYQIHGGGRVRRFTVSFKLLPVYWRNVIQNSVFLPNKGSRTAAPVSLDLGGYVPGTELIWSVEELDIESSKLDPRPRLDHMGRVLGYDGSFTLVTRSLV